MVCMVYDIILEMNVEPFPKPSFAFQLLVAVAAVALSVRFLVNLAAGELLCIVVGLDSNDSNVSFNSLAGPAHATLAAYAAQVTLFTVM